MQKYKKYNIGLDLGVASVGWCVTDDNGKMLKKNGKHMWGSRLFSEANTAAERRAFRSSRRRLERRKERIKILQDLIKDDIERDYPNFFPMLRETSLTADDKQIAERILGKKHNLFSEEDNTDIQYYKEFPTIYHLRKYLITTNNKVDIRLVYLAIHHIIKYRGNFLYEGDFSTNLDMINENVDNIVKFLENTYDIHITISNDEFIKILSDESLKKADKKDLLLEKFSFDKEDKKVVTNIINAILGYKFEVSSIFDMTEEKKISFSVEIDKEDEIVVSIGEQGFIFESLKNIYSWYILQDMLSNENFISSAFIKKYDKYEGDLNLLKSVYKKHLLSKYNAMFREKAANNYVAYTGKNKGKTNKKCKLDDFYFTIKKDFEELDNSIQEKAVILAEIGNNGFLKKINSVENGAIPYQLHKKELEIILEKQSKFYKTLEENKEKIISLLTFRIPYYVGPLAQNCKGSEWSWIVRKDEGNIRPWNFDQIVDVDKTAEEFIRRMTNKCTYLLSEDVMPKQSIIYSKYCVLNEINNLKVNEKHIAKDMKKKIYNELFLQKKKITIDDIRELYRKNQQNADMITGLSDGRNFTSSMSSYIELSKIIGHVDDSNIDLCEKLIYWITIFEDKSILKRKIENLKLFDDRQIKKLVKIKYTGWSRLSRKLVNGIKSEDRNETILEKLENTTDNFMQIINKKEYGFDKKIESYIPKEQKKIMYEDVKELQTSPANKRGIWQAILVVNEIVKIMGNEPTNIYIEFSRNNEENPKLKCKRAHKLMEKYDEINEIKDDNKSLYNELKNHLSDKEFSDRLYLYFTQMGKCLYSGKPLDIDRLSEYQIDHIIPQSYIKDDSLDNRALVISIENQRKSDNLLLNESIQNNQKKWWSFLLANNLITQKKYYRLTKAKMFETTEDEVKFIERQLVETRQITKHVTNMLCNQYRNTKIFALRAELTGHFRNKYGIYKIRDVNNCHHAQDAYIISTIGNIISKKWRNTDEYEYGKHIKDYIKSDNFLKEKHSIVMGMVGKYVDIAEVKECMNYKDYFISRMVEELTGKFYGQTLVSPKEKPAINLKNDKSIEKYGGYTQEKKAYSTIYQYKDTKGKILCRLIGIPVKVATDIKNKKQTLEGYIEQIANERNEEFIKIIRERIMKNQEYIDENGMLMMFVSDSEIKCAKQLIITPELNEILHYIYTGKVDEIEGRYTDIYEYAFDKLMKKIRNEYLCFNNWYEKIIDKKEEFMNLDKKEKCAVIEHLVSLISTSMANLKIIGLSDSAGRMHMQRFENKRLQNMLFIDKSVTGMYEKRISVWDGEQ